MKKLTKAVIAGAVGFAPLLAFAADRTILDIIGILNTIVSTLLPFVIGLAVLVMLWGVFNYIMGAGDEEKRGEAKQYIIWGIIGIFVMVSIWGLVNVLGKTFNLNTTNQSPPSLPAGARFVCPTGTPSINANGEVICT